MTTSEITIIERRAALVAVLERMRDVVEANADLFASPEARHDLLQTSTLVLERLAAEPRTVAVHLSAPERANSLVQALDSLASHGQPLCAPPDSVLDLMLPHVRGDRESQYWSQSNRADEFWGVVHQTSIIRETLLGRGVLLNTVKEGAAKFVLLVDTRQLLAEPPSSTWRRVAEAPTASGRCGCCWLPLHKNRPGTYVEVALGDNRYARVHTGCEPTFEAMVKVARRYPTLDHAREADAAAQRDSTPPIAPLLVEATIVNRTAEVVYPEPAPKQGNSLFDELGPAPADINDALDADEAPAPPLEPEQPEPAQPRRRHAR